MALETVYDATAGTSTTRTYVPPAILPATPAQVDAERDRRIAAGFTFQGKLYQTRDMDLRNINGVSTAATVALMNGALAGDYRWANAVPEDTTEFTWIAADNTLVKMDAFTAIAFGQSAMAHVSALTMDGRLIKNRIASGETLDITDNALWPEPIA